MVQQPRGSGRPIHCTSHTRFHPRLQQIATSLTAMLKTTGSSVASVSRVDDDEVVGGGGNRLSPKVE